MATTKKAVKKAGTTKKAVTKSESASLKKAKSRHNKMHIYAGFILGILSAILFFEIYLVIYVMCM